MPLTGVSLEKCPVKGKCRQPRTCLALVEHQSRAKRIGLDSLMCSRTQGTEYRASIRCDSSGASMEIEV